MLTRLVYIVCLHSRKNIRKLFAFEVEFIKVMVVVLDGRKCNFTENKISTKIKIPDV